MNVRIRLGLVAAALVAAAGWLWAGPASASAPAKDGWWSAANMGVSPPVPPQVPKNGLYVANGYTGPIALAAITWPVPTGAIVQTVTLQVTTSSVVTAPPVACPIASASLGYKPVQNGPWSQKPSYNCSAGRISGTDSAGSVTFDASRLVQGATLAIVVLAGGPADQIAFDPPGPGSLTVVSRPAGPGPQPLGGGAVVPVPASSPMPTSAAPAAPAPGPPPLAGPTVAPTALPPSVPVGPAATPAGPNLAPVASPEPVRNPTAAAHRPAGRAWRHDVAAALLIGAIAVALVAYSEGFGLLGGRVRPVATPPPPHT